MERGEEYVASEAFSGSYHVRIDRVWGRPLGNKATLKITRHAGTAEQSSEIRTVALDKDGSVVVSLLNGRRKELAVVSAPATVRPGDEADRKEKEKSRQVMNRLRAMSNPTTAGSNMAMTGGVGVAGEKQPVSPFVDPAQLPLGGKTISQRIASETEGGMEFAADVEAIQTKDGPTMRLKISPVWKTISTDEKPAVRLVLIPGA